MGSSSNQVTTSDESNGNITEVTSNNTTGSNDTPVGVENEGILSLQNIALLVVAFVVGFGLVIGISKFKK